MAFIGTYPEGNLSWHHLWFLPYLLLYSLLFTPLFVYLKNQPDNAYLHKLKTWVSDFRPQLLWMLLPFYFTYTIMQEFFPVTHNFTNDWFTMVNYFFFFIFGFSLAAVGKPFWNKVQMNRRKLLIAGILSFTVFIVMNWFIEHTVAMHFIRNAFKVVNIWLWITVYFGYAAQYLNREGKLLRYANEAVYPFYILHQSVMLVIAYWIRDWNWGFSSKASIMILGTFGISFLIYEFLIRRWKPVRPLFGLRNREVKKARVTLSRL